ncbi:MAG: hypothetical protein QNJ12_19505 [Ilumatobacter sp.]|uniref:hypothetical protein n=1 Tax=Ilumatobacter sp. TaxID=1967498 RepID=UPI00260566DE|nr:hypothetical protein [Ilumatobacter sp.]MDJ0770987.1 hypothetical protein [Ilumatobacter sp.]
MSDDTLTDVDDVEISPAARTFVVTATGASLAAFNLGFDLGAFENIDHRKIWAMWVLCTVALVSSYLVRDRDYRLGGRWRLALAVPSLWLVADLFFVTSSNVAVVVLLILSLGALPFAMYIIIRLVAGDFVSLTARLRVALVVTALVVFAVGWYVGDGHPRFLSCRDFARAGEFVPANCEP